LNKRVWILTIAVKASLIAGHVIVAQGTSDLTNLSGFPNPSGVARTFSSAGYIDRQGPFFQSLGLTGAPARRVTTPVAAGACLPRPLTLYCEAAA
jgi:hypothetical protein